MQRVVMIGAGIFALTGQIAVLAGPSFPWVFAGKSSRLSPDSDSGSFEPTIGRNLGKERPMTALNIASHDSSSEAPREASDYRFEHLNLGLLLQDMRFSRIAPAPGDRLLDTTLLNLEGQEVSLRSLAAGGPIALVTGSTHQLLSLRCSSGE